MTSPTSSAWISINPTTGKTLETFEALGERALAERVARAERAAAAWAATALDERAALLRRCAALLLENKNSYAAQMAREMGKPVRQGVAEVEKCAWACEYYAEHAQGFLTPEIVKTGAAKSYVRFDPLGIILAVMPWNFPFWQLFRFAAPTLIAGNVVLLKHAHNVSRCALELEALFARAGAPPGVLQTLLIGNEETLALLAQDAIRGVTLTGSDRAGAAVAERAGRHLKKCVLELGGSDPFIVLDDVDVAHVARCAREARLTNSGQSCIAAKRFLVMQSIADAFDEALQKELASARVGDPLDPETEVGPLAREDLLLALDQQVQRSIAEGARLLTGGRRLECPGFFYTPTLLTNVSPDMPAACEETFGPVAAILRVRSEAEAVAVANASRFGLSASVWSGDPARAEALVSRLEAGCVFINSIVKSDPRLPFGGVKCSGYGRELSAYGLREFVNIKTVCVGS